MQLRRRTATAARRPGAVGGVLCGVLQYGALRRGGVGLGTKCHRDHRCKLRGNGY